MLLLDDEEFSIRFMTASTQGIPIAMPYGLPGLKSISYGMRGLTRFRSMLLNPLRNLNAAIRDQKRCRRTASVRAH